MLTAAPPPPEPEPPPPPPIVRRYADRGTSEVALGVGYSSFAGFLAAGGFHYFLVDGVGPGVEGTWVAGGNQVSSYGLALASVRLVPLRGPRAALVFTVRGGRVFLGDHADGWGAGGGAGVILPLGPLMGVELGYEILRLVPSSFCADLNTCYLQGPVIGLRIGF